MLREPASLATEYSITVPYEVTKLNLDYVKSNDKATVKVRGNSDFKVGEVNTVTIDVTAEDGSKKAYILNIKRDVLNAEATLKSLFIISLLSVENSSFLIGVTLLSSDWLSSFTILLRLLRA